MFAVLQRKWWRETETDDNFAKWLSSTRCAEQKRNGVCVSWMCEVLLCVMYED